MSGEWSFQLLHYIQAVVSAARCFKRPTMDFLEAEDGWSLSFAGAGFLGLYHVGATQCLRQRAPRILQGARRFYGSSSGALNAVCIVCDMSAGAWGRFRDPAGSRIWQRPPPRAPASRGLYTWPLI